ncbi:carbohydrate-binding protein [Paenibacillus rhizovicinus]|uniref:Carbohydrate-binding protein n=1 Tax=Paenibacillus rhizovicinus TaxID=2704463 RepID=A0A6C0P339_9BACL|nr:carbohydrate-binding protein [Paenibacillus rhizovicinus]QHW32980.1 carbohydrate-binding protein [Paenibacillus rhizovicinus]
MKIGWSSKGIRNAERHGKRKRFAGFFLSTALLTALSAGVVAPQAAHAASNYYVAPGGSDSNNGTSLGTPFKTIQKAASVAAAGDTVYIRGGTYRETVTPANSGTTGSPINYQAYQGEDVLISGLDPVTTSWTAYSGNIYSTNLTMGLGDENAVFVNGSNMTYARWPNKTGASPMTNDGAAIGSGSLTSITDSAMPNQSSGWYNGAIVWSISAAKWTAWGATVTGSGGGTVNFAIPGDMGDYTNPGDTTRGDKNYYYLAGKLGLLDAEKEWFYDSAASKLYLYAPGGGSPSTKTVEVKARRQAIDLTGKSNIRFTGIDITGAEMKITGDNNVIDGMTATYIFSHNARGLYHTHPVTDDGIHIMGSNNTVKNGDFGFSDGNIFLIDKGSNNVITNNYIHDADQNGSYDAPVRLEDNGYNDRNYTTITYNTIYNTGRSAIHFTRPGYFEHNDVYRTNIVADDGAPVYLGGDLLNSTVAYNYIHDIYWQSGTRAGVVPAIYMDNGTDNAIAHHNVIYNIGQDAAFRMNAPTNGGRYIYNNTAYNVPSTLVTMAGTPAFTQDNNLLNAASSNFVDAANHNFRLASGSSAINAGTAHAPWTNGYAGSAPDKGAYEFGGTDWTAGVQGSTPPSTPALSYEAEASANTLAGGASVSACTACSGGSVVKNVGNNAGTLQFNNVNAGSAGTRTVTIAYANGDASARSALLSVNGGTATTLSFPPTGSFTTVGTITVNITLNAGNNTLKFYTNAAGVWAPDFDKITLLATDAEAEATGNTLAGGASVSACTACSGGSDVKNVGNNAGTLQFNNVTMSSAGTRTLTIAYLNGDTSARSALLSVNGGTAVTLSFPPTGSFSTVGTITVSVSLNAGSNTLKFYTNAAGVWAPDFDKISVY